MEAAGLIACRRWAKGMALRDSGCMRPARGCGERGRARRTMIDARAAWCAGLMAAWWMRQGLVRRHVVRGERADGRLVLVGMGRLVARRLTAASDLGYDCRATNVAPMSKGSDEKRPRCLALYYGHAPDPKPIDCTAMTAPMAQGKLYEVTCVCAPPATQVRCDKLLASFGKLPMVAKLGVGASCADASRMCGRPDDLMQEVSGHCVNRVLARPRADRADTLHESRPCARVFRCKAAGGIWTQKRAGRLQDIELLAQAVRCSQGQRRATIASAIAQRTCKISSVPDAQAEVLRNVYRTCLGFWPAREPRCLSPSVLRRGFLWGRRACGSVSAR